MRQILVIRHAIAEDRVIAMREGTADEARALTDKGRKRMKAAAAGLRRLVPELTCVASSPLARAVQTAEIVAKACGGPPVIETHALAPDMSRESLLEWAASQPGEAPVAVVGHEPDLAQWVGWLLTGSPRPVVQLKKGSACLVEFTGDAAPGGGVLAWLLTPRQLRTLGETP
jgi:phosphohistidine phosphatase